MGDGGIQVVQSESAPLVFFVTPLGGDLPPFTISGEELQRCLDFEETPVIDDDDIRWSSAIDVRRDLS